ncbi:MAG: sensor histidine kinase [Nocardioidaceae bacterium]
MAAEPGRSAGTRRFGTVRAKLTLLATAVVAAVLAVSAVGLVAVQRSLLTHGIDESLVQRADNVQGEVERGAFGTRLPNEGDPEDSFMQLVGPDGEVVASSANAAALSAAGGSLAAGSAQVIRSTSQVPLSNHDFRVLTRSVDTRAGPMTLVVAKNLDDVNESARILASSLAISIPVVTALLAALVWWLTGRVLRSVESIRAEVSSIQGIEVHRRVPVPRSHDEISRLARTMNEMLDRVQQAVERQRRFVADASHELRSPLTRIRSDLEVGIAHPDAADSTTLLPSLLADATDLEDLVDDLLFLAKSESGTLGPTGSPVDLDDLVLDEARWLRDRGAVLVDVSGVSGARTLGDQHQLARAIHNLASNAERHATTAVSFELLERDGHCELAVSDDGRGIPSEHHASVFERFNRLDEARSRDAGGSGLGLAIVHDIVTRHGGTIVIASANGEGARFVVSLPRSD